MGMFDTLVDGEHESQVKLFYRPIYSHGEIGHSGGLLSYYHVGYELPLVTPYYEYPSNFYIFLDDDYGDVYIPFAAVRDGRFDGFVYQFADACEFSDYYTYHGEKIRASNIDEMYAYQRALKDEWTKTVGRNFVALYDKWHEPISPEHRLGELYECFKFTLLMSQANIAETRIDYTKQHFELGQKISDFQQKYPDVFDIFTRKWDIEWEV